MLQGKHILVVDDFPTIRKFLRNLLVRNNVEHIDEASSGQETMALIEAAILPYDMALLDFMLPDIDGIQLLQQIRLKDEQCTIVMITGTGGIKTATMAVNNGADGYINKQDLTIGNDPADFYFALEQALERRGGLIAQRELQDFKADFYSMVTHDLRNPTGSIKLSSEMLLNGDMGQLTEEQLEVVQITFNSATKLLDLINNYLDFAKIDAGYLRIDIGDVDLRSLVESATKMARFQTQAKEQTLTLDVPPGPVTARADGERLKQVFDNLISNAVKYTPYKGSITVHLSANETHATFRVSDTGYGVSAEQLPQLFTKYHRVPGQSTRGITGTGLGLLIVKEIVTSHGGTIEVQSDGLGLGTTFTVTLPSSPLPRPRMSEHDHELERFRAQLRDSNEAVRESAVRELTVVGFPLVRDLLLEALGDRSLFIRQIASESLTQLADDATITLLAETLRVEDSVLRNQAMETLAHIGTRATPFLIALLHDADSDVRIFAANVLAQINDPVAVEPLCAALRDDNENVRTAAAEALGKIGDKRAIKPLLEAIQNDEWVRFIAIAAIGLIGDPSAQPPLLAMLSGDPWLRYPLIDALGLMGDGPTGETLRNYLHDENLIVGHAVVAALGQIDLRHNTTWLSTLDQPEVVALLASAITSPEATVRRSAVTALGWVGSGDALFLILPRLEDTSEEVSEAALNAIIRFAKRDPNPVTEVFLDTTADHRPSLAEALGHTTQEPAPQILIRGLKDAAGPVRAASARALGRQASPTAFQPLLTALTDPEPAVRTAAAGALGGVRNQDAIASLLKLIEDEDPAVRSAAAGAIGRIGGSQAITQLAPLLQASRPELVETILHALAVIEDKSANALIVWAMSNPDAAVRRLTTSLIGKRRITEATPALEEALADPDWQVRKLAADSLGLIRDEQAVSALVTALRDTAQNVWVRYAAARALGAIGSQDALNALLTALKEDADPVKLAAVSALGQIGNERAITAIQPILNHADPDFRKTAAEALGNLPGNAASALLGQLLQDANRGVRLAAVAALGKRQDAVAKASLSTVLRDPDLGVRQAAEHVLQDSPIAGS